MAALRLFPASPFGEPLPLARPLAARPLGRVYAVHSSFLTLQGEGAHAGSRAVFVRLAGCNVWSGDPKDRARDVAKGGCAAWCDTEFRGTGGEGGGRYAAGDVVDMVEALWNHPGSPPLVVFTGGEPSLQLDAGLVEALKGALGARIHVETNGSRPLPAGVDWVTLSPKPPMPVVAQRYDEVKVVYPAFDPLPFEGLAPVRWVQPLDGPDRPASTAACARFVLGHPAWRLTLQTHKDIGLP